MKRREFIRDAGMAAFGTLALTRGTFASSPAIAAQNATVAGLQSAMASKDMTSVQLVEF